jgi:hypothetical protein
MKLPLFVVYDHPTDYPDLFVIRIWENEIPKEIIFTSDDIDVVRGFLRMRGLVNLGRYKEDDLKILEVWV